MKSSSDWQQIISQQQKSKLSVAEFCKKNKITASVFYARRKKLRSRVEATGFREIKRSNQDPICIEISPTKDGLLEFKGIASPEFLISLCAAFK